LPGKAASPRSWASIFFRRAVALAEQYRRPGQRVCHTVQTNGTLVDDEWARFFRLHDFLLGLSVDGPRELHDIYRVDKAGRGTFDHVMRGLAHLRRHDVDVNILCTVHKANQDHPLEVYRFFRDELEMRYLQFIPVVERATPDMLSAANAGWSARKGARRPFYSQQGSLVTERSVDPDRYGAFLIAIFDEWVRRDVGTVFVQHFDSALANWLRVPGAVCVFNETCGTALALEHNGDVYSCDHFVQPDYKLGNITETPLVDLVASDRQHAFGHAKRTGLPRLCRECLVRFACHGECPRNRFVMTPDGEAGLNHLCAGYKAFFTHIDLPMQVMADLLRRGRYADEIMPLLASDASA
jgi:serine-type anaerobic sulfatase-maturating enzyme